MQATAVSPALRERLGDEGTLGLLDLFVQAGREWKDEVLASASDRFARTLVEETGKLRVLIAEQRAELLKWSFIFWIGQVAAMAALLAFMLRGLPR